MMEIGIDKLDRVMLLREGTVESDHEALIVMRKSFVLSFGGCALISAAKSTVDWRRKSVW